MSEAVVIDHVSAKAGAMQAIMANAMIATAQMAILVVFELFTIGHLLFKLR